MSASPTTRVKMAEDAFLGCMSTVASAPPVSLVNTVRNPKVRAYFAKCPPTFNAYLLRASGRP